MQSTHRKIKDTDLLQSEKAMQRAAAKALELGRKTNTPVYVWENGKIVDINDTSFSSKTPPQTGL